MQPEVLVGMLREAHCLLTLLFVGRLNQFCVCVCVYCTLMCFNGSYFKKRLFKKKKNRKEENNGFLVTSQSLKPCQFLLEWLRRFSSLNDVSTSCEMEALKQRCGPGGVSGFQALLFPASCTGISWFHSGNAPGCALWLGRAFLHYLCWI